MKKVIIYSLTFILCFSITILARDKIILFPFEGEIKEDKNFSKLLMNQIASELNKKGNFNIKTEDYSTQRALNKGRDTYIRGKTSSEIYDYDNEFITEAAKRNNARYVLYGSIERLGSKMVIVISILDIKNYRQVAGDYREVDDINESLSIIPSIAEEISSQMKNMLNEKEKLNKLLVPEFINEGGNLTEDNLNLLSQMMSIDIFKTGKYSIFPYNYFNNAVKKAIYTQQKYNNLLGMDFYEEVGRQEKMDYTLIGNVFFNDNTGSYTTSGIVVDLHGEDIKAHQEMYQKIEENTVAIPNISEEITGIADIKRKAEAQRLEEERLRQIATQQEEELKKRAEAKRISNDSARSRMLIDRNARISATLPWVATFSAASWAAGITCLTVGLVNDNLGLALGGGIPFFVAGYTTMLLALLIDSWYPYKPIENFALAPSINYNQDGNSSYGVTFAYKF